MTTSLARIYRLPNGGMWEPKKNSAASLRPAFSKVSPSNVGMEVNKAATSMYLPACVPDTWQKEAEGR